MAHADYNCCAICDCKMSFKGYDSALTKEEICTHCLKGLRDGGVNVLDVSELKSWISGHDDPKEVVKILTRIGYQKCWFENDFDDFVEEHLQELL